MATELKTPVEPVDAASAPARAAARRSGGLPFAVLVPIVLAVGAAIVYGPVTSFVYSEFSDVALQFGAHPWYQPLPLGDVIEKYFTMRQGWYRPTSFYAVPYLLRLDYFQPGAIAVVNLAFFVLAASSLLALVRRPPFAAALFCTAFVLFAPTLYLISYGVQIDSLYILFGIAFIAAMLRLDGTIARRERIALWVGAVLAFVGAITSKEIAIVLPFMLVPLLVMVGPEFSRARIVAALRTAAPFIAVSIAFVVAYTSGNPTSNGAYDTSPSPDKLPQAISLTTWTFGFRSPVDMFANWIPPWGSGQTLMSVLTLIVLVGSLVIAWRALRTWRIALFALTYAGLAVAIALPGGLPHHAYPLVALIGAGALAVTTAAAATLRARSAPLAAGYLGVLALMGLLLIVQGRSSYGDALYRGPQTPYLQASKEIFYGSTLAPVRAAQDPLFVFEDCLGGLHNPLRYFAKAADGQEVVVAKFDPTQFASRFANTARAGRESFVAQCTGGTDPWYRLLRYDPTDRRLVPAPPG